MQNTNTAYTKDNYMHSSFATKFWLRERNAILSFRHTQNLASTNRHIFLKHGDWKCATLESQR